MTGDDPDWSWDGVLATAQHGGVALEDVGPPRRLVVDLGGLRLNVLEWGPLNAPPVLLLHGGSLNAHSWDVVCAALAPTHRCLAVDLRGHGDSQWPADGDYRLATVAVDVAEVWRQLGHASGAPVVIGLSFGGLVGLHAIVHGLVEAVQLVLVDITPDLNIERSEYIRTFAESLELPTVDDFVERARAFNSRRPVELLRHSLRHNLHRTSGGGWTWKYDPARMAHADFDVMEGEHGALWQVLDRVVCPVLVVHGERSRIVGRDEAERFAVAFPNSRIIHVKDAGHTVHSDNPAAFVAALREFLQ